MHAALSWAQNVFLMRKGTVEKLDNSNRTSRIGTYVLVLVQYKEPSSHHSEKLDPAVWIPCANRVLSIISPVSRYSLAQWNLCRISCDWVGFVRITCTSTVYEVQTTHVVLSQSISPVSLVDNAIENPHVAYSVTYNVSPVSEQGLA